jgi:uncharacterized protein YcaQ
MDCKADRKASLLHIHHLALEGTILKNDAFLPALLKELYCFLKFNHCNKIQLHRTSPANIKPKLQAMIQHCTDD